MPVLDFPIPPFGKEICYNSNGIKLHKRQESAGSAVGDQFPTRPINISSHLRVQNDRARHDEYLLD